MSFFFSNLQLNDVMVLGWREQVSKANKPFIILSVADSEGNANDVSTSEPETMASIRSLKQGDKVDLRLVCAGGPKKQYAMLARGSGAVMPSASPSGLGY